MQQTINLLHLRFFCDAVIYGSVTESAKNNFISQSAVSQAISKLESICGVKLVYFNKQKIQLTDEGKVLFEQAKIIFRDVKTTFELLNQTKENICGSLCFACTKSLGMSIFAPLYKTLKDNLPTIDFTFKMGGLNLIRNSVKHDHVNFAIVVYDEINFGQFEKYPLRKGQFRLYKAVDMPVEPVIRELFVSDIDCIYVPEIQDFLKEECGEEVKLTSLRGWDLTARFASLGLGVGFFPDHIVSHNRYPFLEVHPIKTPFFEYEICAIFNKGKKLTKMELAFLDCFK